MCIVGWLRLHGATSFLDLGLLSQFQRILNVYAKIPDGVLDRGVTQQDLNRAEITGRLVDDGRFSAPQRVSAVIFLPESDGGHPLINEPSVLARAQMTGMINSAWEGIVVDCSTTRHEPSEQTCPGITRTALAGRSFAG